MNFYEKIKDVVSEITKENGYKDNGTAFGHFIISECFNKIIDFDFDGIEFDTFIKNHIVDMSCDLGNDAVFTNQKNNEILVFQFKYSNNALLNTNEVKKNKRFIDWVLGLSDDDLRPNKKLKNILEDEISKILSQENIAERKYHITFYYIDHHFPSNIKTDIYALHTNYRDKEIPFSIKFYDYEELDEIYEDIEIPKNEVELKIVPNEYFIKKLNYHNNGDVTAVETIVTSILANSLKPIIEQKKELILALNVRYYKGENEINSKIKEEYSKGKKSNFWLLNNGINGVCEHFEVEDGILKIKNFQIVNGGQTSKTLTRIVNDLPDEIQILLRLTKITDKTKVSNISMNVAIASNSQNAIKSRDLHSGDKIQRKIFEYLNQVGVFYDKKDGEWSTVNKRNYKNPFGKSPMYLKINNLDLGISYLSFYLQIPISTIGRYKLVFSDLYYDEIFSSTNNEYDQFNKLMLSYRIALRINELKQEKFSYYEILQNNYINDVILSLSSLFFCKDTLHRLSTIEELKHYINQLNANEFLNKDEKYTLKLGTDFDDFTIKIISVLQNLLDVKKEAKKMYINQEWLPTDTNNWLKKNDTYKEIFEWVIKKIK
jgi:hypothetical protein